ncbi:hypothetical protein AYR54_01975 [Loigolactobacillus backii]|uniref:glycosyltransferase family 2 protein n=1 Tax=Loigolactobacillus backii TaxID=375175 RepID=UPI0007F149D5|nr:glycosyltransferase family 2 protein [Loigolactobacillus backii]ANK59142.1 hypothetical protein AYR52_01985 [Loigolactobacillus backii]ANK64131.1 hypothetical protein AYR54_01975 [Loigolactobacillus backii]ANK67475.1 hypothetical protein AYR55_07065 [Loigolactobacillus backii]OLF69627.1 hypothetical protein ACX53_06885 [Loigolactobacillus backii]PIO88198.1 hypothetical protein B8A32_03785 [Loigolactobacillus backii]
MVSVSAVVVTYNRLDLLKECLAALLGQSYSLAHLIVIDNHSDAPTQTYLKQLGAKIDYVRLKENIGGAGGFYSGIKYFAEKTNDDFVWLMDDDTIPDKNALNALVAAYKAKPATGFLASNPKWVDGTPAIMNVPVVAHPLWTSALNADSHLIEISRASFVSVMTSRAVVLKLGLPIRQFFIWGDDTEYTERITQQYKAYLVPDSLVTHKMKLNRGVNILEDDSARAGRYFYAYRNRLYNSRRRSRKEVIHYYIQFTSTTLHLLFGHSKHRWHKLRVIFSGMLAGITFRPKIEFPNVK